MQATGGVLLNHKTWPAARALDQIISERGRPEQFATCETGSVAGLLFFLAHPDDETFIAGGTIAKYAAAGEVD